MVKSVKTDRSKAVVRLSSLGTSPRPCGQLSLAGRTYYALSPPTVVRFHRESARPGQHGASASDPVLDQGNVGSRLGNSVAGTLGTTPLFRLCEWPAMDEAEAVTFYSLAAETIDGDGPLTPPMTRAAAA